MTDSRISHGAIGHWCGVYSEVLACMFVLAVNGLLYVRIKGIIVLEVMYNDTERTVTSVNNGKKIVWRRH